MSNFVFLINNCLLPGPGQVFISVGVGVCPVIEGRCSANVAKAPACGRLQKKQHLDQKPCLNCDTHTCRKCHPHLTFSHKWQISEYRNNWPSVFNSLPPSLSIPIRAFDITACSAPTRRQRKHPCSHELVCKCACLRVRDVSRVPQWALTKQWLITLHVHLPLCQRLSLSPSLSIGSRCDDGSKAALPASVRN